MSTKHWVKPFARAGYAARGIIYTIIGFFTLFAGLQMGSTKDSKSAISTLVEQPFGRTLLVCLVVGLAGYVTWRLIQSLADTDDHGWTPKGIAVRLGLLASAFTYTSLAFYALSSLGFDPFMSSNGGGGSNGFREQTRAIIGAQYVALFLSLIFAGVGLSHMYKAFTEKYADHIDTSAAPMNLVHPISKVGLTARGIIFMIIAVLLFYQFRRGGTDDNEVPGIKDALSYVQSFAFGNLMLIVIGVGIILFAAYSFCEARWRRINVEDA